MHLRMEQEPSHQNVQEKFFFVFLILNLDLHVFLSSFQLVECGDLESASAALGEHNLPK